MNSSRDIDIWAEAFIRVHDADASLDENHPDYWAAYEFMGQLVGERAEVCWQGVLAVVSRMPSERVLGMLAAGIMEDLLGDSGAAFIDRIEDQVRRDPIFKKMLHSIWPSGTPDVWSRLESAR